MTSKGDWEEVRQEALPLVWTTTNNELSTVLLLIYSCWELQPNLDLHQSKVRLETIV